MNKVDRKRRVQEISNEIDDFVSERTDSYERSIEDLEEIQTHVQFSIDAFKNDIKKRDSK